MKNPLNHWPVVLLFLVMGIAAGCALGYWAGKATWWICNHLDWGALKKLANCLLWWALIGSLARMFWNLGTKFKSQSEK